MQAKMDGEGKLYKVDITESETVMVETVYATTSFKIVVKRQGDKETVIQKFLDKLQKKGKLGDYKIPRDEWPARKEEFIAKKMKPMVAKPTGEEYEGSFKALFKQLFPE